jgi:hypothetical protein
VNSYCESLFFISADLQICIRECEGMVDISVC